MNEKGDAYVQKLKAQLDEWNADINKLEAKDLRINYLCLLFINVS